MGLSQSINKVNPLRGQVDLSKFSQDFSGPRYFFEGIVRIHNHTIDPVNFNTELSPLSLKTLDQLDGEFALVIADPNEQQLVLLRDQIGTKPLYYAIHNNTVHFDTSLDTLLQHRPVHSGPDLEALGLYLLGDYSATSNTFFKNVYRVAPGTILRITKDGIQTHWRSEPERQYLDLGAPLPTQIEALHHELLQSVEFRTSDTRSLGLLASGGLDSSLLLAIMNSHLGKEHSLTSYSNVLEDLSFGNSQRLEELNRLVPHRHHYHTLDPDHSIYQFDPDSFPIDVAYDPSLFLFRPLLRQAASDGLHVYFTGLGGDEVFTSPFSYLADLLRKLQFRNLYSNLKDSEESLGGILQQLIRFAITPLLPGFTRTAFRTVIPRPLPTWINPEFVKHYQLKDKIAERFARARQECPYRDHAKQDLYYRLFKWGGLTWALEQEQSFARQHNLECRWPLLDLRLIRLAFHLPQELLLWRGWGKRGLREVGRYYFPDSFCYFDDGTGYFSFSKACVLHQLNNLRKYFTNSRLVSFGLVRPEGIAELLTSTTKGNYAELLRLLNAERWLRKSSDER